MNDVRFSGGTRLRSRCQRQTGSDQRAPVAAPVTLATEGPFPSPVEMDALLCRVGEGGGACGVCDCEYLMLWKQSISHGANGSRCTCRFYVDLSHRLAISSPLFTTYQHILDRLTFFGGALDCTGGAAGFAVTVSAELVDELDAAEDFLLC